MSSIPVLQPDLADLLQQGSVIPAHPLALNAQRKFDERHQRALSRYYVAAGAGGIAVGVHSTQFEIREHGLFRPVLELAQETVQTEIGADPKKPFLMVAGVAGPTEAAVREAELAAELGYHAVLLSPPRPHADDPMAHDQEALEKYMLHRARAVAEVLPVIGFYLQEAIRGPRLSYEFWREFVEIDAVVAIKAAPFHRYRTMDVARAVVESGRASQIALYTGNDDAIVHDLISPYTFNHKNSPVTVRFQGGLLGHWSVWTKRAVELLDQAHRANAGDLVALNDLVNKANAITDANSALFDAVNNFAGCIPGTHEVLRRQGLLQGTWCLDPNEVLSPGQKEELDRVIATHPWMTDDEFVKENLDEWLK